MRPRVLFPVRPFDPAPPWVVDAAKLLFTLRTQLDGTEPFPTGRHPLPLGRSDSRALSVSSCQLPPPVRGEYQSQASLALAADGSDMNAEIADNY